MSDRRKVWSFGLVALLVVLAWLCWWDQPSREVAIPLTLIGLGLCALIAEGLALRSMSREAPGGNPSAFPEARPADGVVDVVPIQGVVGEVNAHDARFQRFVGLVEGFAEPTKPQPLTATNPVMLGQVTLVCIFVGRDGNAWTDLDVAQGLEAIESAGVWIEREAIRCQAMVNLALAGTYFQVEDDTIDRVEVEFADEGDDVGPMEANASTNTIISATRAAVRLGFANVLDLMERINPRVEADSRAWLFLLRRAGRSLAIPAAESELSGVGLAVCFAKDASFPEPWSGPGRVDPTTLAHEVLHLFGASDKYGVSLRSYPGGSVTARDIMRLNHKSLLRMRIDPLTATEIGWSQSGRSKKNARQ